MRFIKHKEPEDTDNSYTYERWQPYSDEARNYTASYAWVQSMRDAEREAFYDVVRGVERIRGRVRGTN